MLIAANPYIERTAAGKLAAPKSLKGAGESAHSAHILMKALLFWSTIRCNAANGRSIKTRSLIVSKIVKAEQ
jgi:hypothetical protein